MVVDIAQPDQPAACRHGFNVEVVFFMPLAVAKDIKTLGLTSWRTR